MTDQSKIQITRVIYYKFKWACNSGNIKQLQFWSSCLSSYVTKQNVDLDAAFSIDEIQDIEAIMSAAENGWYYRWVKQDDSCEDVASTDYSRVNQDKLFDLEEDLKRAIISNEDLLRKHVSPGIWVYDCEHRTRYGRVDVVCKDQDTVWVIELKRDLADHQVVSQVIKYAEHFENRMIWNLWSSVRCATIAARYTPFAIKELNRLGVLTLSYKINDEVLSLNRVKP